MDVDDAATVVRVPADTRVTQSAGARRTVGCAGVEHARVAALGVDVERRTRGRDALFYGELRAITQNQVNIARNLDISTVPSIRCNS